MLDNEANRPQMLIKDGMGTLISKLIYSKWQVTSGHQPISLSLPRPKMTTWNQMVYMRKNKTMKMAWKKYTEMLVSGKMKMLTCHTNVSWTYFFEYPFRKELPLFLFNEDLIGASFFGLRRRHWPIPIGWATSDNHSSALKTAYGEADRVIYLWQYTCTSKIW